MKHGFSIKLISDALLSRGHDVDENVRFETVTVIANAAKKGFDCIDRRLLDCLAERRLDKKVGWHFSVNIGVPFTALKVRV